MAVKNYAKFTISLSAATTVPVSVEYTTVNNSATAYGDYITASGTLVFPAGTTTKILKVRIRGSLTSQTLKQFTLHLSTPVACTIGTNDTEYQISGPPTVTASAFPGRRMGILGDSIMYANNHYNPPLNVTNGGTNPARLRNAYFSTGMTGVVAYANAIMNNALELEPALQPNTNPGANATSPNNGYNFAIYSSKMSDWDDSDFDPLVETPVAHNVGPYYNALAYASKFDMVTIMGGTNDLSGGATAQSVINLHMLYGYGLAALGKWVFVQTISPRTADLLQLSATGAGYNQAQIAAIMQAVLDVNTGLRNWLNVAGGVPNIFLVDHWSALVGPTASILSVPTDPCGMLSPSSGITSGALISSTPGNYRSDAQGLRFNYDGLHFAPAGAYAAAVVLAQVMTAAGVPGPTSNTSYGGSTLAGVAPMTIGTNLMQNTNFNCGTTASRTPGTPLILGRSIGLGAPVTVSSYAGLPSGITKDAHTNQGGGYLYGPVPDYWFLYRASNSDGESYSNFNNYTYSTLNSTPSPAPMSFQVDSTWADGCLTTAIVNETITLNGVTSAATPGYALTFTCPTGGSSPNQQGFVLRYDVAEGQHGVWDNYGYEGSNGTGPNGQQAWPAPPYSPGDAVMFDCVLKYVGLTPNLCACRVTANWISYDPTNPNSASAVISSIALAESFYPFINVQNCHQHTVNRTVAIRSPTIICPAAPLTGEIAVYCQINFQFSFDCSSIAAAGTIKIFSPRLAKVKTATGTVPSL